MVVSAESAAEARTSSRATVDADGVANAFIGVVTAIWLWPIVSFLIVTGLTGSPQERWWAVVSGSLALGLAAVPVLLPPAYFRLRSFEDDGRIYAYLGVRWFRLFVLHGDLMNRWLRRHGSMPTPLPLAETLRIRAEQARVNECMHLGALLLSLPVIVSAIAVHRTGLALYLILGNILLNVYPILLQRYTRGRLERIVRRRAL